MTKDEIIKWLEECREYYNNAYFDDTLDEWSKIRYQYYYSAMWYALNYIYNKEPQWYETGVTDD